MAEFKLIEKNKYRIIGTLTNTDVERINNFKNRTTLILDNTVGLSSELVSKIVSDRVVFSIKGGLDYDAKEKYKEQKYVDRTFVSPRGLEKIIKYFEYNEQMINPDWNEFEKAMFLYNALVVDMDYQEYYENIQSSGTTERSLNGILYSKLVCAGFALVYKEMLDRIGIKNYYQNQKDVHAFNIIEIDGKKYGVDITWDNNDKQKNNGECRFGRFGHDSDFYNRDGHQLYKDVDTSDDFEKTVIERIYDSDEEMFDLSLIDMKQLQAYYNNISSAINNRRTFKYDLQTQPIETKYKYLPVDMVEYNLTKEANQEYSVFAIIQFLKKRNSLKLDQSLMNAISSRQGYVMDIASDRNYGNVNLSYFGLEGYEINVDGNLNYDKDGIYKRDCISGAYVGQSNVSNQELDELYTHLNQYLNNYFKKYIFSIVNNLDDMLNNYEYKPDEFDNNRFIENANIYSKLNLVSNSPNILTELGFNEEQINTIIQKITSKYNEIHKPYEKEIDKRKNDLDYLYAVFGDINLIWQTIEHDLQKQISESEFVSKFQDVDYMLQIFDKYMVLGKEEKFDINNFSISKSDLQGLLNTIIDDYQNVNQQSEDFHK